MRPPRFRLRTLMVAVAVVAAVCAGIRAVGELRGRWEDFGQLAALNSRRADYYEELADPDQPPGCGDLILDPSAPRQVDNRTPEQVRADIVQYSARMKAKAAIHARLAESFRRRWW